MHDAQTPVSAVSLPPDAPRPPFAWTVSLPLTWRAIDLDPQRTEATVANMLRDDDVVPGVRLKSAEKRQLKAALLDMATQAREAGAIWTLVLPGLSDGYVSVIALLLRWADSAPEPANVLSLQSQLGQTDTSVEPTRNGNSFVLASSTAQAGPVTQRRTTYTHQAFIPVPSTTWTLAVSATAPDPDSSEDVKAIVSRVAASLVAWPDMTEPLDRGDNATIGAADASDADSDAPTAQAQQSPTDVVSRVWVNSEGAVN